MCAIIFKVTKYSENILQTFCEKSALSFKRKRSETWKFTSHTKYKTQQRSIYFWHFYNEYFSCIPYYKCSNVFRFYLPSFSLR